MFIILSLNSSTILLMLLLTFDNNCSIVISNFLSFLIIDLVGKFYNILFIQIYLLMFYGVLWHHLVFPSCGW
jgi:hypothetical protein